MEEEESLAAIRCGTVTSVQAGDPLARGPQSSVITRHALRGRIQPVGEDGKAKIAARIRQEMHFEPLDLLGDFSAIRQEHRHDDHGSQMRWHPVAQLEARQHCRRDQRGDASVQQSDGQKCENEHARWSDAG